MNQQNPTPRLFLTLFLSTFKIGLVTFGGGLAMIPFIRAEFCDKRGWIDSGQITDIIAASQTLPGVIAVNTSALVGYRIAGVRGALTAGFGSVLPSFLVIVIVAAFYNVFIENAIVRGALRGISGAVAALFASTLIKMRRDSLIDTLAVVFFFAALALVFIFPGLNVIFIILAGGLMGFVTRYLLRRAK
ncbi:MAG: chromate transporter [Oscillospiraceae bacterium]|jgi:chromate transporter|nr:chromate transporter [Oscillospiraceae bacterium]